MAYGMKSECLPPCLMRREAEAGTTARLWIHSADHVKDIDSDWRPQLGPRIFVIITA
jgi:hypothetical protein